MKNFFIHIGIHKTGSSAIQNFLSQNKGVLKKHDFLYPGNEVAHHVIAWALFNHPGLSPTDSPGINKQKSQTIYKEIKNSSKKNIIISTEVFNEGKSDAPLLLKDELTRQFGNDYSAKIIVYLRRQDLWLESAYQEKIKGWYLNKSYSFSEYLIAIKNEVELDYYTKLSQWSEYFGKENLLIRIYEKNQLPNGIFSDFFQAIGLNLTNEYTSLQNPNVNVGLSRDAIEIIRLCKASMGTNAQFRLFLARQIKQYASATSLSKTSFLSPEERIKILQKYEVSNKKVAEEYLGREDGRLFYEPWPDPDEPWEPYEGLTVEKVVPIFTQMLFNMDKHYQKQFNQLRRNAQKKKDIWKKLDSSFCATKRWIKKLSR